MVTFAPMTSVQAMYSTALTAHLTYRGTTVYIIDFFTCELNLGTCASLSLAIKPWEHRREASAEQVGRCTGRSCMEASWEHMHGAIHV